jgi:thioredoxin-related protein
MKSYFILVLLFVSTFTIAQNMSMEGLDNVDEIVEKKETAKQIQLDWLTNLDTAKAKAKKTKKPILVYFTGSDWCPPCKKLEKHFFHTDQFEAESKKYVLVYLDNPYRDDIIPRKEKKENKITASKYKVNFFPVLIALDHKGVERNRVERFSGEDATYHWKFMNKNKSIFKL